MLCCKHSGASYHPQRSKYKCNTGVVVVFFSPVLLFPVSTVDSLDDCAVPPTRLNRPCVSTVLLQVCACQAPPTNGHVKLPKGHLAVVAGCNGDIWEAPKGRSSRKFSCYNQRTALVAGSNSSRKVAREDQGQIMELQLTPFDLPMSSCTSSTAQGGGGSFKDRKL